MNKILRMAFVAAVALVSTNTFAQDADVTFTLTKMIDNGWEQNQSLDGVEYAQKGKDVTIAHTYFKEAYHYQDSVQTYCQGQVA